MGKLGGNRQFGTVAGAALALLTLGSAQAADIPSAAGAAPAPAVSATPWAWSFGAAFVTDYNFRGISQSARGPAVQTSAELTYTINPNWQLYANIFGSSVKLPSGPTMELDVSAGVRPSFGNLAFDFGFTRYGYPKENFNALGGTINSDFMEYYGKVSYKFFDKLTIGGGIYHAPNWLNLGTYGTYYQATAALELPHGFAISGEYGHYALGRTSLSNSALVLGVPLPDYNYWNAGISYTYKSATIDLRYHDSSLSKFNCNVIVGDPRAIAGGSKWCGPAFIASLKFSGSDKNLFGVDAPAAADSGAVSPWALAFGMSVMTDYNFRGISQSARGAATQASAELTYTINPNFQIYANIFGSSVKLPSGPTMELDVSAGVRPSFGNLAFDFGVTRYGYPKENFNALGGTINSDFWEYYGKASYKFFDKLTIGAGIYHAPDWLNLGTAGTYYQGTAALELPHGFAVSGEYGHYTLGRTSFFNSALVSNVPLPDYNYWNAGISYTYKSATVDLRYHDTDLSKFNCNVIVGDPRAIAGGSKWCGPAIVGSLKFNFTEKNFFGSAPAAVTAKY
ncbi:MAG: TorF family putative porin [Beijerinckiaceae bacterium]